MIWAVIPILALLIPIVAILSATIVKPWLELKHRQLDAAKAGDAQQAADQADHVARLEQRVRVLERIVTDHGHIVAQEIERLRVASPHN